MKSIYVSVCVIIAAVFLAFSHATLAREDSLLNYQFSGEILEVNDPWGIFGQNQVGDTFTGGFLLFNGVLLHDLGGIAEYVVDVVGQPNQYNVFAASQEWQPLSSYTVFVAGPTSGIGVGNSLQFNIDQTMLDLSRLPAGFEVIEAALAVEFLSTDLNLPTSYPNLPDSLHPLSNYDATRLFLLYVNLLDPSKQTGGTAALIGEVISLQAIPDMPILIGDVNCDGTVNLLDVAPFVALLTSGQYLVQADINEDGTVSLLDVQPFVNLLSGD